jgi:hypothetical protein
MNALLEAAVAPYNVVYTGLLMLVLLYWVTVIFGALDIGAFDFDVDTDLDIDVDVDVDADVDVDSDADVGSSAGWLAGTLHFFNFGKLPFMVIMTFLIFSMWAISILANHYIGGSWFFALILLLPNLFVSLVITKILTTPLVPVFKDYKSKGVEAIDYIGQLCTMRLPATSSQIGQAEVRYDGDSLLITVKVVEGGSPILKGEKALIINRSEDEKYFIVRKEEEISV